ncbi:MAG: polyhydroxyalkanoic acid system family protein [Myxococcota bacterium]
MATIKITQDHNLPVPDVISMLKKFETEMGQFGVSLDWNGSKAKVKGTGVSGSVEVVQNAVTLILELGLLAKAAGVDAAKLEPVIKRKLRNALRGGSGEQ